MDNSANRLPIVKTYIDQKKFQTDKTPWLNGLPAPQEEDFSFVIFGDRTGGSVDGIFERALAITKQLQPEFVVSVGDLVEGSWTDEAEAHEEWDEVDALIEDLGIPFFQALGNHDYNTRAMAQVWRERKGFEYYAVRIRGILFLFVNTETREDEYGPQEVLRELQEMNRLHRKNPRCYAEIRNDPERMKAYYDKIGWTFPTTDDSPINARIDEAQIDFFADVLRENEDALWTFVVMHQPAWKKTYADFERLESLLVGRKYTFVAGHLHHLDVREKNGREYIQMGKTGGSTIRSGLGDINHILWVRIHEGAPHFQVIKLDDVVGLWKYTRGGADG